MTSAVVWIVVAIAIGLPALMLRRLRPFTAGRFARTGAVVVPCLVVLGVMLGAAIGGASPPTWGVPHDVPVRYGSEGALTALATLVYFCIMTLGLPILAAAACGAIIGVLLAASLRSLFPQASGTTSDGTRSDSAA